MNKSDIKCLDCSECLEVKCDIYKRNEFKKAWDKFIDTIAYKLKIYKILDCINKLISKK